MQYAIDKLSKEATKLKALNAAQISVKLVKNIKEDLKREQLNRLQDKSIKKSEIRQFLNMQKRKREAKEKGLPNPSASNRNRGRGPAASSNQLAKDLNGVIPRGMQSGRSGTSTPSQSFAGRQHYKNPGRPRREITHLIN